MDGAEAGTLYDWERGHMTRGEQKEQNKKREGKRERTPPSPTNTLHLTPLTTHLTPVGGQGVFLSFSVWRGPMSHFCKGKHPES